MPLWRRIFLVQASMVLLACVALIALQQVRLERGLLDYVDQLEVGKARNVAALVVEDYQANNGLAHFIGRPRRLGHLIEAGRRDLAYAEIDWSRRPQNDGAPPPHVHRDDRRPPPPGGPARPDAFDFVERFSLLDASGTYLAGNPKAHPSDHVLELRTPAGRIGELRLERLPKLSNQWDRDFLQDQLHASMVIGLVVLSFALLASVFLARKLAAPLRALSLTAQRITDGDFSARSCISRQDEIGELAKTLDKTAETLEQVRAARQRWTADISHELRTPVTVLRAETQALEDGIRKPDAAALASLSNEIERLTLLIEDLYQLSLSDIGALDYHFEKTELITLIDAAVAAQSSAIAQAGLQINWRAPTHEIYINADARRLAQVLSNLLSNSVRYTDRGGQIEIAVTQLVNPSLSENQWRIELQDSAPGVSSAHLAKLGDPLFRADASRSRAFGGAGLGLAIAKAIVGAHGGTLSAHHSILGGVRMQIDLPAASE